MTKLVKRIAQIFRDYFGYFEKCHLLNKSHCAAFWATFDKHWATFHFNIWSHRLTSILVNDESITCDSTNTFTKNIQVKS